MFDNFPKHIMKPGVDQILNFDVSYHLCDCFTKLHYIYSIIHINMYLSTGLNNIVT
ncbi:unnamed protein product [Schistosoma curassoni]|uniref:Uncharacterized protein n=1 Tax=Schistosoma curassoni TaxID=6186 RepID=A0A183JN76_9TREM|nr:unnamed protein product [Schistosoma curassoni]